MGMVPIRGWNFVLLFVALTGMVGCSQVGFRQLHFWGVAFWAFGRCLMVVKFI